MPATVPGPLESQQTSPAAAAAAQTADFIVEVIISVLVNRPDAASILASVTSRIAIASARHGVQGEQPSPVRDDSVASTNARMGSMQHTLSKWHTFAADRRRFRAISRSISSRSRQQPVSKPSGSNMNPGKPSPPSPPTVQLLGERSREERDAELRMEALSFNSLSPPSTAPPSSTPSSRQGLLKASSHSVALITADAIPAELQQSPSYSLISRVLRAPVDLTHRDWRSRAFYEPEAVAAYQRWSDPEGKPHRDAADALAALSDPDALAVPPELRSSDPNISAEAWDRYRRELTAAMERALTAGVDWLRALRAMDLIYSDPGIGHPRISQYVTSAMSDRVLLRHPLLHAEVLRFRLDSSFADGSPLYSKESYIADWERATARLPGEDVVTLATRVTEAYLKKVSDPKIDVITVWASSHNAREIATRFTLCLLADPINRERGSSTNYEFETAWHKINDRVQRGAAQPSELNIISVAERELRPHESAAAGKWYDLTDIDDSDSVASESSQPKARYPPAHRRHGTTGRGARGRRAERRALLGSPSE